MGQDRPLLGVVLMLGFCALAPMGDALAKRLGETAPLLMLLFFRFGIQALLLLPFAACGLLLLYGGLWFYMAGLHAASAVSAVLLLLALGLAGHDGRAG